MSATKPEKCPRCGCVEIADSKIGTHFACHTLRFSDDGIVQSLMCAMNQRDQLAEEVRRLKAVIADHDKVEAREPGKALTDSELKAVFERIDEPEDADTFTLPRAVAERLELMGYGSIVERRDA